MTAPNLFTPPPMDTEWTQLHLSRLDRTFRYRVHHDLIRLEDLTGSAPSAHRFELEYLDRDGTWRPVCFYARRDEIWAHLVKTGVVGR